MEIKINNAPLTVASGSNLADVLVANNITTTGIATAVNGKVIAAHLRKDHILAEGDSIIIIKAFYGG